MTDREILDEIYNRLCNMLEANDNGTGRALKSFIEQEWQRRDEEEMDDHPLTKSDEGQMYRLVCVNELSKTDWQKKEYLRKLREVSKICPQIEGAGSVDVKDIEGRSGLKIGKDGTV